MNIKKQIFMTVLFLSASAFGANKAAQKSLENEIKERNACVIVVDLKDQKVIQHLGQSCAERVSPCSTFKVPLALMAFQEGKLVDRNSSRKWDGQVRGRNELNQDQTAATWLEYSVVWFSQRLTTEMGMDTVKKYLAEFNYGNKDFSGGLMKSWIDSSLKISPDEQMTFMKAFWQRSFPLSKETYEKTLDILPFESFLDGTLKGKTGSNGSYEGKRKKQSFTGWYVGYYSSKDHNYAVVSKYHSPQKKGEPVRPGLIAKALAKSVLEASLRN